MGEWAVLMSDVLTQTDLVQQAKCFGPDGGVTDMAGKYFEGCYY